MHYQELSRHCHTCPTTPVVNGIRSSTRTTRSARMLLYLRPSLMCTEYVIETHIFLSANFPDSMWQLRLKRRFAYVYKITARITRHGFHLASSVHPAMTTPLFLVRIIGFVSVVVSPYISTTPPIPPAGPKDEIYKNQSFEHLGFVIRNVSKVRYAHRSCDRDQH